ncbi:hypothetical protein Tco_0230036 [Tanacetum coccineum]
MSALRLVDDVGKAKSLASSSSEGNGIGVWVRTDILEVVWYAGGGDASGDGGVAADSSVSNGYVFSEKGTWSTTSATTKSAGARCSSSSSEASSSSSLSKDSSSLPSPPSVG